MAQDANWDEIRDLSAFLADAAEERDSEQTGTAKEVRREGKGFVVVFGDGSEVTYTPAITRDAP
jgi:hypothetical protein